MKPDKKSFDIFSRVSIISGLAAAILGGLTLAGWFSGYLILTSFGAAYKKISPHGSIMLILAGSLLVLYGQRKTGITLKYVKNTAFFILVIEAWSFVDFASGKNLFLDRFIADFFSAFTGQVIPPISPLAVCAFFFAGCSLILLAMPEEMVNLKKLTGFFSLPVFSIGAVIVIGYLYAAPLLYGTPVEPAAIPIGIGITFLGIGLIAANPQLWPLRTMLGASTRSLLLRYALPFTIGVVIISNGILAFFTLRTNLNPALISATTTIFAVIAVSIIVARLSGIIGAVIDRAEIETQHAGKKIIRLNRLYSVLSKINESIVRIREPEKLYKEVCGILVEQGPFRMVWIGIIETLSMEVKPVTYCGYEDGFLASIRISGADSSGERGPLGNAIRERKYFICNDIEADPRAELWRSEALRRGYASSAAFPVTIKERVVGAINIYSAEPYFFNDEEIDLIKQLTADISFALESAQKEDLRASAEERLRQSELRFRSIIENATDVVTLLDSNGAILYQSPSIKNVYGYSYEMLEGRSIFEFIYQEDAAFIRDVFAKKIKAAPGAMTNVTGRFRHKDGALRFFEGTFKNMLDNSAIGAIVLNFHDITERRELTEALKQSEEWFNLLFENSPVPITITRKTMLLNANKAYLDMFGYRDLSEIYGKSIINQIASQQRDEISALSDKRARGEKIPSSIEITGLRKDGSQFPFMIIISSIQLPDGPATIGFYTSASENKCP